MPKYKPVSGDKTITILCKEFGFIVTGQTGSHVRLSKLTKGGKVGTVIPRHKELKEGTLKGILKLAKIDYNKFKEHY